MGTAAVTAAAVNTSVPSLFARGRSCATVAALTLGGGFLRMPASSSGRPFPEILYFLSLSS